LFSTFADAAPPVIGDAHGLVFSGESCFDCLPGQTIGVSATIQGHMIVAPVTGGQFWDARNGSYSGLSPDDLMVLGISGTLTIDCGGVVYCPGEGTYSLSFLPPGGNGWSGPLGDGSWIRPFEPRYVVFSADGSGLYTRMINDNAANLLQWTDPGTGQGGQVAIHWNTRVVPLFSFTGFFSPVDNAPVVNSVKAGAAIPVKFSLGGNQGLDIFPSGFPASQQIACDNSATLEPVEETVSAGQSGLTYDASVDEYIYVWKTQKSWAQTCRQFVLWLTDGSLHVANFKFGK
jgi:hypothetical protein